MDEVLEAPDGVSRRQTNDDLGRLDFSELMHGFSPHVSSSQLMPEIGETMSTAEAFSMSSAAHNMQQSFDRSSINRPEVDMFHSPMLGDIQEDGALQEGHRILMQQWKEQVREAQMKQQYVQHQPLPMPHSHQQPSSQQLPSPHSQPQQLQPQFQQHYPPAQMVRPTHEHNRSQLDQEAQMLFDHFSPTHDEHAYTMGQTHTQQVDTTASDRGQPPLSELQPEQSAASASEPPASLRQAPYAGSMLPMSEVQPYAAQGRVPAPPTATCQAQYCNPQYPPTLSHVGGMQHLLNAPPITDEQFQMLRNTHPELSEEQWRVLEEQRNLQTAMHDQLRRHYLQQQQHERQPRDGLSGAHTLAPSQSTQNPANCPPQPNAYSSSWQHSRTHPTYATAQGFEGDFLPSSDLMQANGVLETLVDELTPDQRTAYTYSPNANSHDAAQWDAYSSKQQNSSMSRSGSRGRRPSVKRRTPGDSTEDSTPTNGSISRTASCASIRSEASADGSNSEKKVRFVWEPEVHRRFCEAVHTLGVNSAKPQAIAHLMQMHGPGAPTRQNIKSHLQKYRIFLAKRQQASTADRSGDGNQKADSDGDALFASFGLSLSGDVPVAADGMDKGLEAMATALFS